MASSEQAGIHTRREIFQQPGLWATTLERIEAADRSFDLRGRLAEKRILFTGAGTSAYAAQAIATARPGCVAVPTTDLLVDAERFLTQADVVISLARSGDSPESSAVIERVRALRPSLPQFAITCNPESRMTRAPLDQIIFLDPRSNDQSLVMTSAFSNLVLGGLTLLAPQAARAAVNECAVRAEYLMTEIDQACRTLAGRARDRVVILFSSPLFGWSAEARLKILEMTAGTFPTMSETFLGLRHGPMSYLRKDTLALALFSNDPVRRAYERDLLNELRAKKIGYLAVIGQRDEGDLIDMAIPPVSPGIPDAIRTPFEIIIPQLLGFHLSLNNGFNPDNPSPSGVINRVVQGVTIHTVVTAPNDGSAGPNNP